MNNDSLAEVMMQLVSEIRLLRGDMASLRKPQTVNSVQQADLDASLMKCPLCNGPMKARSGYKGPFFGCLGYPNCKGTRNADGSPTKPYNKGNSSLIHPDDWDEEDPPF
jgi:hypothetical protein